MFKNLCPVCKICFKILVLSVEKCDKILVFCEMCEKNVVLSVKLENLCPLYETLHEIRKNSLSCL